MCIIKLFSLYPVVLKVYKPSGMIILKGQSVDWGRKNICQFLLCL